MRAILALLIALLTAGASVVQAQADYYARLGLTASTKLLSDVVINQIEVRQSLAPTLALGASMPFAPTYRAGLEATLTTAGYHSREQGAEADLGTLRTASILLDLEGPIRQRVGWRAGAGLIGYWPGDDRGIFLRGGTTRFLAGAGLDYRPRLGTNWDLMVSLRYDFHRFTTEELTARGFTGTQGVQRVSASIGLARPRR
ncbi:MAG TPA: hypothetical protein VGJ36_09940 [Gemmatimonadales bacterium]|jgi:hypothetical protein